MNNLNNQSENKFSIYVACLASYNNGILHGEWIDIEDTQQVKNEINGMLKNSLIDNAEEWAIHDYHLLNISIDEYESIEYICKIVDYVKEHGGLFIEVLNYYNDLEDTLEAIENNYLGCYETLSDYVEECSDLSDIPDNIIRYIDFEKMARDEEMSGYINVFEYENDVHVFAAA